MRIAFFGSPRFAVPTLERLLGSAHTVVAVVAQPDRPHGRGQRVNAGPVKEVALEHGVPVLQPDRLKGRDFLQTLESLSPDLGVVAAYGKILPDAVLQLPRLGLINVHASLLPRWRGAAPVQRAIIAGDAVTGVTIMRVVAALDAGPTFASRSRPMADDETAEDVERDLSETGADLLIDVLSQIADGHAAETAQDEGRATYAPRLTKEEGLIDWTQSPAVSHNRVRGLHPWPHAYTFLGSERLILLATSTVAENAGAMAPGTVVMAEGDDLRIAAGGGMVRVNRIQAEGRKPMSVRDFLAGHRLAPGQRLGA